MGGGVASEKDNCSNYCSKGRLPINTYATVQMQSDAWQDDDWKNS